MTYFVTLDDKKECVGVYCDGELHFDGFPTDLGHTWQPTPSLASISAENAEFAYFYANGQTLTDVCPEHLKEDWRRILKRMESYRSSFQIAKVDLQDNCLFDLIPKQYLLRYCDLKTEIIKHVFKTHEKPENYDFMRNLAEMLLELKEEKIKLRTGGRGRMAPTQSSGKKRGEGCK